VVLATVLRFAGEIVEQTAPDEVNNPILPTGPELVWGAITFCALWALMKWVLLPPVLRTMENREAKVRADLEAADAARAQAEAELDAYEASLLSTKTEAVRIIEDARTKAEGDRKQVLAQAESEVAAQKAQAAQEVAEAKQRAKAELQGSVAGIAIQAAEAVVQKQIDREAQARVIEDYVNRAGSQN
jgi:F-type H+-transporting ATPase subunit b